MRHFCTVDNSYFNSVNMYACMCIDCTLTWIHSTDMFFTKDERWMIYQPRSLSWHFKLLINKWRVGGEVKAIAVLHAMWFKTTERGKKKLIGNGVYLSSGVAMFTTSLPSTVTVPSQNSKQWVML